MARSLNKVILIGNVGSEPEIRTTRSGKQVANVSLATNWRENETEWHRLVFWDKLAEIVDQWVHKGDRIYVEGRIQYGSYERDGVTIPTCEIHVRELVMLGGTDAVTAQAGGAYDAPPTDDSGLPF